MSRYKKHIPHISSFYYCYTCDKKNIGICRRLDCSVSVITINGNISHAIHNVKHPQYQFENTEGNKALPEKTDIAPNSITDVTNIIPKEVTGKKKHIKIGLEYVHESFGKISPLVEYVHRKVTKENEDWLKAIFGETMEPKNLTEHLGMRKCVQGE